MSCPGCSDLMQAAPQMSSFEGDMPVSIDDVEDSWSPTR
jgi:hypothetical protein